MSCERITSDFCSTKSPDPSSTEADVSSQEVSIPRMTDTLLALLIEQMLDERPVFSRIPVVRAEDFFADDSVTADYHRYGIPRGKVDIGDPFRWVVQHFELHAVLFDEIPDAGVGTIFFFFKQKTAYEIHS